MRVHLSALIALVSATSYVACGSSDPTDSDQDAGAGGGLADGGEPSSSGGSKNSAGSKNTAGDTSPAGASGGPAGEGGGAGEALGGAGGAGGDAAIAGGAGAGGAPVETGLPAACPGVLADYTQLDGTTGADTFMTAQLSGNVLAFGLEGDDVFERDGNGGDCLVGGPGDDDLTNPGESASYLIGGSGADTFHLSNLGNNYTFIVDMSADDSIGLSKTNYSFLVGTAGDPPPDWQVLEIVDYEAGTGSVPAAETAAIVYDPATGGIWRDLDRGLKGSSQGDATQIATIVNHASYTFNLDDFVLDD